MKFRFLISSLYYKIIKLRIFRKYFLLVYWYKSNRNFGDELNKILLKSISGKKVIFVNPKNFKSKHLLSIGSILGSANEGSIIWGSGLISKNVKLSQKPKKIYAVRGPLTRKELFNQGIECPEVYGDPGLLIPKYYNPSIKKEFEIGIIPHYVDKENLLLNNFKKNKKIKIIDIQDKDPYRFINNVLSCKNIASSSLHGIIIADAYKIPSLWLEFSNNITGDNFKFFDYFMSVKKNILQPFKIKSNTTFSDLLENVCNEEVNIDLDLLLNNFPNNLK